MRINPRWLINDTGQTVEHKALIRHQLSDMWKSPRGTVVRIEALSLLAIALSFFLAAFGSFRRRSGHWFIQKGILAANVLSLSLGTYSIGLMQSSSVKSEVYPFWAVSMLTLFCCIDPVTAYGLEYKSQLWKMLYQLLLYCGYVLLVSILTISSDIGYIAIGMLSAITFIKGFHRSLALMMPSIQRDMIQMIAQSMVEEVLNRSTANDDSNQQSSSPDGHIGYNYVVHWPLDKSKAKFLRASTSLPVVAMDKILQCNEVHFLSDVCLSFSLSHLLQRRFYRLNCVEAKHLVARKFVLKGLLLSSDGAVDYKRVFKVIEVELAFLYDTFFTGNAFLHYYESKGATIWGLASIIGICFVGVAAVVSGTRSTHTRTHGSTTIVDTTTIDLIITLVILVSLALMQFSHLIHCWSSNWARVAFACDYIQNGNKQLNHLMRLRRWVLQRRIDCDKSHLWQNKLGQYSLIESITARNSMLGGSLYQIYSRFLGILGLQYIEQALREMLGVKTGNAIELHADVKEAIVDFIITWECKLRNWPSSLQRNGWPDYDWTLFIPGHVATIIRGHIATCYCELVMHKEGFSVEDEGAEEIVKKNHGVATALSKYCAYLMVSKPRLLHRDHLGTTSAYSEVAEAARVFLHGVNDDKLEAMRRLGEDDKSSEGASIFLQGVAFGKHLEAMPNRWEFLAEFWVGALLYAAPSDNNAEDHIECLAQGGEFITHLWALLSHAGILNLKGGPTSTTYYDESPDLGGSGDDSLYTDESEEEDNDDDDSAEDGGGGSSQV